VAQKILIFEDSQSLSKHLLQIWWGIANQSFHHHRQFNVALSGGKTPQESYHRLSQIHEQEHWKQTNIFLCDERFVPSQSSDSNLRMIKKTLLNKIDIPSENIHAVTTDSIDILDAVERYEKDLKQHYNLQPGQWPCFDLIILGVGTDGHTASLFPDGGELNVVDKFVVAVSPKDIPHDRVSLTLPVLNHARHIVFLALGKEKSKILKKVFVEKVDCPVSRICPVQGSLTFLIDRDAAQLLPLDQSDNSLNRNIEIIVNT